jgi:hypothetical protein
MVSLAILASVLMHLSERKHELPGIYPFNKYSSFFLWFDRIMAYLSAMIVARILFIRWNLWYTSFLMIYICIGLISMGLSELMFTLKEDHSLFAMTHSLWHLIAFSSFYFAIQLETVQMK